MSESREWTAARDEYTYQLVQEISPPILEIFETIYSKAREDAGEEEEDKSVVLFQLSLQQIPHWNNISIERECKRIITGYPSLMDHVAAVFVSNIQILSCVRLDTDSKKDIHIKIPPRDTFIHKVLIQCAENIFADPILFWHNIEYGEKRENKKKKEALIGESIEEAIRGMLPIQEILKEYLAETGGSGGARDKDDDDNDNGSGASKESEEPDSDSSGPENTNSYDLDTDDEDGDDEDTSKHIPYSGDIGDGGDGVPAGASSFGPTPTPQPEQYQPPGEGLPNPPSPATAPGQNMFSGGPTVPPPAAAPPPAPAMAAGMNQGGGDSEPGHHESAAWEGDSSDDSDDE